MRIFAGVRREGASSDSVVVKERNFHRLLAGCMFENFTQDI